MGLNHCFSKIHKSESESVLECKIQESLIKRFLHQDTNGTGYITPSPLEKISSRIYHLYYTTNRQIWKLSTSNNIKFFSSRAPQRTHCPPKDLYKDSLSKNKNLLWMTSNLFWAPSLICGSSNGCVNLSAWLVFNICLTNKLKETHYVPTWPWINVKHSIIF